MPTWGETQDKLSFAVLSALVLPMTTCALDALDYNGLQWVKNGVHLSLRGGPIIPLASNDMVNNCKCEHVSAETPGLPRL